MELSADVLELLRKDDEFLLYRDKSSSVLLLAPVSTRPALESLRKIEQEYSLKDELDPAWAVRPLALSQQHRQPTLVLEDPGGETLDRLLPGPLETTQFLRFAVGLAASLGGLHKKELIHKDVKPANVLVNLATGEVRLMGFGIASRLPRERQAPEPPEFIPGTLPFMAPEQTGRMNRSIDSRSDLYALGVTEILTGSLPFSASDPVEPGCHLAQAFQSLIHPLLRQRRTELSKWRNAIRELLDPNGQLILDLIQELKPIIGEQWPVPELPPQAA